jgi:uncharacterized protein YndB with AHSA1/START domain
MKSSLLMNFSLDTENNKVKIHREFAAPVATVWSAWTEREILDQWWAPKPWHTQTKKMDFKVGGYWLYAMVGPDGSAHYARADYKSIDLLKNFTLQDAFCDAEGNIDKTFPRSIWSNHFTESSDITLVSIEIQYEKQADMETFMGMGFKEGFTAALENLDELFRS